MIPQHHLNIIDNPYPCVAFIDSPMDGDLVKSMLLKYAVYGIDERKLARFHFCDTLYYHTDVTQLIIHFNVMSSLLSNVQWSNWVL
jgi:hypothetical protein